MIVLRFELIKRHGVTAKHFREYTTEALHHAAETWQEEFLQRHFSESGRNIYGYRSRNKFYREVVKREEGTGKGKTAMLVLSGRSERAARYLATITASSRRATIRMPMPRYFTHPFIGVIVNPKTGRRHTITQQPDKVAELTKTTSDENNRMARSSRDRLVARFNATRAPRTFSV